MLRKLAIVFGVVFVVVGLGGFIPGLTTTDNEGMKLLLGLFMVGTIHNIIHLASGAAALLASKSGAYSKLYFQVFGAVYALVTLVGFIQGDTVLGLIHVNTADNFLHLALAVVILGIGFGVKEDA